ncbi:serine kinase [Paracoccus sp. MBLB3053]|uniref:Serine kinase n=1 Tax=Paracoccus aurantius TaxID=3073814 RepID=A0ABU2HN31_9RHOB|nr:serine kinase [Paracoccus sp. MBLB3053]MDS9465975.1 serine kinase [Paracoccus sp. MBLB3053]
MIVHASCVALGDRALLILGGSGSGKSSLALQLMAMGCGLVSDDRTSLAVENARLVADCPAPIRGRIEARGVGILNAEPVGPVGLVLAVDLDQPEPARLPPHRKVELLGICLPLVLGGGRAHLAPALLQYLVAGRWDQDET